MLLFEYMSILKVHSQIVTKLDQFHNSNRIPNIIFHGPTGSGKRTILNNFLDMIYKNNKEAIKSYVLYANCAHGKGIKFVRDELKFFAKTHVNMESDVCFKSVVLTNAESLTTDAQSALRRCIEQFSHNTRFFIIINEKSRLLKPILSRFCEIYVPLPMIKGEQVSLHDYAINNCFGKSNDTRKAVTWIKNNIHKVDKDNYKNIMSFCDKMYERGYSGLDLLAYIETMNNISNIRKATLLITFNRVKKEYRNEKLFIAFILTYLLIRSEEPLENVSFM